MREDWIECKFGDIINFKNGYAFKSTGYLKSGIPVIRIGDIKENEVIIENAICVDENKDLKEYEIVKDDILIAMSGATTGKFGRYNLNDKAYLNQRVGNIKPLSDKYIYKSFLYYLLSQLKREIEKSAYGGAQPNISSKKIEELTVAFAPLPEQRAIVKKLESLLSSLNAGVADLKKAQQQLKIYRQAVLKKAFEGELTKYNLSDYLIKIEAGKSFKCKETTPSVDEVGILKISAVTWGEFNELESKTVEDLTKINISYFVNPGDFLMSRANTLELVGNSVIVNNISRKLMLSDKTLRLKFTSEIVPKYVLYFLSSKDGKGQIMSLSTGNQESMRNISQSGINKIKIPIPQSIEQQKEIVKQIESRLSVCDSIEQNIKESLKKSEALRQSILKKAFEGNLLTAQELAECKLAEDYEPAYVLLERIKAEKKK